VNATEEVKEAINNNVFTERHAKWLVFLPEKGYRGTPKKWERKTIPLFCPKYGQKQ